MPREAGAGAPARSVMRRLEQILLGAGLALLIVYAVARFHGEAGKAAVLARFEADRAAVTTVAPKGSKEPRVVVRLARRR